MGYLKGPYGLAKGAQAMGYLKGPYGLPKGAQAMGYLKGHRLWVT